MIFKTAISNFIPAQTRRRKIGLPGLGNLLGLEDPVGFIFVNQFKTYRVLKTQQVTLNVVSILIIFML